MQRVHSYPVRIARHIPPTVPYRPQGNGQAKHTNFEVTKLRMYCSDPQRAHDWDLTVGWCAWAYNNTVHTATGFTPFFLLHGYHLSSLYTTYWPSTQPPYPSRGAEAEANEFRRHHHACLMVFAAYRKLGEDAQCQAKQVAAPVSEQP
jgi:hypothetical protein